MRFTPPDDYSRCHLWQITPVCDLIIAVVAELILWVLYSLGRVFAPLFLSLILADILNPFINWTERKYRWPRPVTVAIMIALGLAAVGGLLVWLIPLLIDQITEFTGRSPLTSKPSTRSMESTSARW